MFDLLASADLLVPKAPAVVAAWTERIGILAARGSWAQTWPDWGFDSHWCRVRRDVGQAPTFVEIIAALPHPDPAIGHPYLAELEAAQGRRLHKTHSIPIAVTDLDAMIERLARREVTFRLDPPEGLLPFRRLWLGRSAGAPGSYDARSDGGLFLEFMATPDLGMPIATSLPEPAASETNIQRIEAKTVLVEDLDAVLRTLEDHLGWQPATESYVLAGCRRARLGFTHVLSAALELIQPLEPGSPEADYAARWGSGPYGLRIEVDDLDLARERLCRTETPFREIPRDDGLVILPDYELLAGPQVELVSAGESA